jgi:hypothetical protein
VQKIAADPDLVEALASAHARVLSAV